MRFTRQILTRNVTLNKPFRSEKRTKIRCDMLVTIIRDNSKAWRNQTIQPHDTPITLQERKEGDYFGPRSDELVRRFGFSSRGCGRCEFGGRHCCGPHEPGQISFSRPCRWFEPLYSSLWCGRWRNVDQDEDEPRVEHRRRHAHG